MTTIMSQGRKYRFGFSMGSLYISAQASARLCGEDVTSALQRHADGDWGDLPPEDGRLNDEALLDGTRLVSVYHDRNGVKFWVITEADRLSTAVRLPDDY
jgi:hypothetical protein